MPKPSRPSPSLETIAADARCAAGEIVRGMDLQRYDPLRAALAERFAPAARAAGHDTVQLIARIRAELPAAMQAVEADLRADVAEGFRLIT